MSLQNNLNELINNIDEIKDHTTNETATRTSFINPFLEILGYDVRNPRIVKHEHSSGAGGKQDDKVDYAIFKDKLPIMIIEAKHHNKPLDGWSKQLEKYFNVMPDVKFAILTNGIEYRFFTDFDNSNLLDKSPFLNINLEDMSEHNFRSLEKFAYGKLDLEAAYKNAKHQKYIIQFNDILIQEFDNPSDSFIDYFVRRLNLNQQITSKLKDELKSPLKQSLDNFITNKLRKSLQTALSTTESRDEEEILDSQIDIITTEEEIQAFHIIRAILSEIAPLSDITYKDNRAYFTILAQNNSRKWVVRLWLDSKAKYISFNNSTDDKNKRTVLEGGINNLYSYKSELLSTYRLVVQ